MSTEKNKQLLHKLKGEQFIKIFKLEDSDDSIFNNYQRYDFHQVIWFTKVGKNNHYFLDFNEYTIRDNQVTIVFPGQIDMLDVQDKEGYLFAIHNTNFFRINQQLNSDLLNGYFSNAFISLPIKEQEILHQIIKLMQEEQNHANKVILMESYMQIFLYYIITLHENSEKDIKLHDLTIGKLMRLIDANFIHQRETIFYAKKMGFSLRKINEISVMRTGKTVKQHLQDRLILEIKREIQLKEKSLKEIAFDLGFSEPAYFTRFFKQQTTFTPTEFKNQ